MVKIFYSFFIRRFILINELENFENCQTTLKKLFFIGNSALSEGGAISWMGRRPSFDFYELMFRNNSALYGSDVSSYAVRLGIYIYNKSDNGLIYTSNSNLNEGNLVNVSSGNLLPYRVIVQLLDVYDNVVTTAKG